MDEDLRAELIQWIAEDDETRERLARDGSLFAGYHPEMEAVHRRNAARLRGYRVRDLRRLAVHVALLGRTPDVRGCLRLLAILFENFRSSSPERGPFLEKPSYFNV